MNAEAVLGLGGGVSQIGGGLEELWASRDSQNVRLWLFSEADIWQTGGCTGSLVPRDPKNWLKRGASPWWWGESLGFSALTPILNWGVKDLTLKVGGGTYLTTSSFIKWIRQWPNYKGADDFKKGNRRAAVRVTCYINFQWLLGSLLLGRCSGGRKGRENT